MILITGGAGFIGSNFVLDWISKTNDTVINLDLLTYAGNLENLKSLQNTSRHIFIQGDIGNRELIRQLLDKYRPEAVINFAAESHVDRSIHGPAAFVQTNVVGTFHLLEAILDYWRLLDTTAKERFRLLHISTDEVYGSLEPNQPAFNENSPYAPNSPYAATKAASDHLVRSYHQTYGLPTITTNCSNNYGPYQFPEKLIPLIILNALAGKMLPLYGDGLNVRDWLYVRDHCEALRLVLARGRIGETYNIGGRCERTNLDVVRSVCHILDRLKPRSSGSYTSLINFVKDRPGHDRRYSIDCRKVESEIGWRGCKDFDVGLEETVIWYIDNQEWVGNIRSGNYQNWIKQNHTLRNGQ